MSGPMDNEHKKVGYFYRCRECGTEMDVPGNLTSIKSVPRCYWCDGVLLDRYFRQARPDGSTFVKLDRKVDSKVEEAEASLKAEQVELVGTLVDSDMEKAGEKANRNIIGTEKLDEKLGKTAGHVRQTIALMYSRVYGLLHGIPIDAIQVKVGIYNPKARQAVIDVHVYQSNAFHRNVDLDALIYIDELLEKALNPYGALE